MDSQTKETEIIDAARRGDLYAFNSLILEHQDLLFRIAARLMRDEMEAADMVQEACLLAFQKLGSFRGGSFRNWFASIVVNLCYDELRRQRRHPEQCLDVDDGYGDSQAFSYWLADFSTNPEAMLEARELENLIQGCLEKISPRQRAVLVLIDIEDFSYDEAAEILGLPIGTIKSRLARARIQMREHLQSVHGLTCCHRTRRPCYDTRQLASPL